MNVPKKANDAMHLSMLDGLEESLEALGEVLLQDTFTVWDPKQIIRKGRERRLFLFDGCLLFSKEVKDSSGKSKYMFKFKLMVRILSSSCHCCVWICLFTQIFFMNLMKLICMCVCVCVCVRERERERERVCMHACVLGNLIFL